MYDEVLLYGGVQLPEWKFDNDPEEITWQTKSIDRPAMDRYKISKGG